MAEVMLLLYLGIKGEVTAALWSREDGIGTQETFAAASTEDFESGVLTYLEAQGAPYVAAAAISAPGWEQDGIQYMPNHGYNLDHDWLRKLLNIRRVHIVNPTVARALALPFLKEGDVRVLCPGVVYDADTTKCVIGTGPGLGMAILFKENDDQWTAFSGAGGHMDLAVSEKLEFDVLQRLTAKHGHVSRERAVSLSGLRDIWLALVETEGAEAPEVATFDTVVDLAKGGDARALQAIELCIRWLAKAAADMVLLSGARGGVYLTGQLVEQLLPFVEADLFQTTFIKGGPIKSYLSEVPVNILTTRKADFRGLVTLFS